jgi:hypothetical protein
MANKIVFGMDYNAYLFRVCVTKLYKLLGLYSAASKEKKAVHDELDTSDHLLFQVLLVFQRLNGGTERNHGKS